MEIGFWNTQGVSKKNALIDIRDFCTSDFLKIVIICELKTKTPPSLIIANQYGFQHVDYVSTLGLACGLWLLGKDCNTYPFNLVV